MAVFRYYLSPHPSTRAPLFSDLVEIIAEDVDGALEKIKREHAPRLDWPATWAHVLVWSDGDEKRGFRSIRIR